MLRVRHLYSGYDKGTVVHDVTFDVKQGEIVTLIGTNGAGKTTTLKTIAGLLRPTGGQIEFQGKSIAGQPAHEVAAQGIVLVPEGRKIFPHLSVAENLKMGGFLRFRHDRNGLLRDMEQVVELFPVLKERWRQPGGTLSGGEQQMLAIARGLMAKPSLMMLDEPTLGLAPKYIAEVFRIIDTINDRGTTILLVEQNARLALALADRGYVLEAGRVVLTGTADALLQEPLVLQAYVGSTQREAIEGCR